MFIQEPARGQCCEFGRTGPRLPPGTLLLKTHKNFSKRHQNGGKLELAIMKIMHVSDVSGFESYGLIEYNLWNISFSFFLSLKII